MSIGTFLYYLTWPLVWFYSPLTTRVRVIIRCQDEILVVKNWFGSGRWQLPGGGIRIGENTLEAANREIKEELSMQLKNTKKLTTEALVFSQDGMLKRNQFVLADMKNKPQVVISREISQYQWIKISDFELPQQITAKL